MGDCCCHARFSIRNGIRSCRRIITLYIYNDRLCRWQLCHRADGGSLWYCDLFIGGCHFELGLLLRGNTHIIPVGHLCLSIAFGFWNRRNLWAIDRRCIEMVSNAARYRGRHRSQWELFIGRDMAAFADRCSAHIGMAWGVFMAGGLNTYHYGAIVPSAVPSSKR